VLGDVQVTLPTKYPSPLQTCLILVEAVVLEPKTSLSDGRHQHVTCGVFLKSILEFSEGHSHNNDNSDYTALKNQCLTFSDSRN
jgi:hypothetical protein